LNIPEENFIITDLVYSQKRGLQVSGFTKPEPHKMTVSVWNHTDDGEWEREFEKNFNCDNELEIEGQIYWSLDSGFMIPYTWKTGSADSSNLKEEYYYVNRKGNLEKLPTKGFSGISNMIFAGEDRVYWKDFMEFSLKRWNCESGAVPKKVKLSGVKKVSRIAYAGDLLYVLGFNQDVALYNLKIEKEIPGSENLIMLAKDLFYTERAGNDFAFAPYIDENEKEILYYIDNTGLWKYQNGEKTRLISDDEEAFGENTFFTGIAVKDEKTIFINLFNSKDGVIKEEILRYDLKE